MHYALKGWLKCSPIISNPCNVLHDQAYALYKEYHTNFAFQLLQMTHKWAYFPLGKHIQYSKSINGYICWLHLHSHLAVKVPQMPFVGTASHPECIYRPSMSYPQGAYIHYKSGVLLAFTH